MMIKIEGRYYHGRSSKAIPANISVYDSGEITLEHDGESQSVTAGSLNVSSRIGNTPRFIRFEGGAKFETADNDSVDEALKRVYGVSRLNLHGLESRLRFILPAVLVVVIFTWGFLQYGMPGIAHFLAVRLPAQTSDYLGVKTLEILDEKFLNPSTVPMEQQEALRRRFIELSRPYSHQFDFQLLFRASEKLGANAFALPSGTIVITDELIQLGHNNDELVSVLAHEIGHVVHRHTLRYVIQNSLLSFLVLWLSGDVGSSSAFIATLPVLMADLKYSRHFEYEADQYAMDYMLDQQVDLRHFICIMRRLQSDHQRGSGDSEGAGYAGPEFLSTHPNTEKRLLKFSQYLQAEVSCPEISDTFIDTD